MRQRSAAHFHHEFLANGASEITKAFRWQDKRAAATLNVLTVVLLQRRAFLAFQNWQAIDRYPVSHEFVAHGFDRLLWIAIVAAVA